MRAFSSPRHFSVISCLAASGVFLAALSPVLAQNPPVAPETTPVSNVTTFKNDAGRTGFSPAKVSLPLNLMWRFSSDAPPRTYQASPLVLGAPGQQRVIFAGGRIVYCLDAQTGAQIWKSAPLSSRVVVPLTLLAGENGDLILCATQGGRVEALRTADGGRSWTADARSSISDSAPLVAQVNGQTRIIVAVSAGRLIAFKPDGTSDPDWEVKLGRYGTSPNTSMALSPSGTLAYLIGSDAKLYAVDIQKPALAWVVQLAAQSSVAPLAVGDQVIVANSRVVSAFRGTGGESLWNMPPRSEVLGSPAARTVGDLTTIYFGTTNGIFYAVEATGTSPGAVTWKTDLKASISGTPLALSNAVIVGTRNGFLVALAPGDGGILWQYRLNTERVDEDAPTTRPVDGGGEGAAPAPTTAETAGPVARVWGVSSSPSAIDNRLFVLADNAAMYGFTTQPFDAEPPRVIEPSLAVPDDANKIAALLLNPDAPQVVPGRGPIYFAAQLDDTGSGIDATTVQITLDGAAIPAAAIEFSPGTGVLTATLLDPEKGGTNFPDGLKTIGLNAKDYAGNALAYTNSFLVDNTAEPPAAQIETPTPGTGVEGGGAAPDPGVE